MCKYQYDNCLVHLMWLDASQDKYQHLPATSLLGRLSRHISHERRSTKLHHTSAPLCSALTVAVIGACDVRDRDKPIVHELTHMCRIRHFTTSEQLFSQRHKVSRFVLNSFLQPALSTLSCNRSKTNLFHLPCHFGACLFLHKYRTSKKKLFDHHVLLRWSCQLLTEPLRSRVPCVVLACFS